jgi:hypothetical protein
MIGYWTEEPRCSVLHCGMCIAVWAVGECNAFWREWAERNLKAHSEEGYCNLLIF